MAIGDHNSARDSGFRAMIRDASLWDLVHLKCEARAREAVRIASGPRTGHLYFAEGRIVHAIFGTQFGEAAALEILSWRAGSWDASDKGWPRQPTIHVPFQSLLLRAAQRQDEAQRDRGGRAVSTTINSGETSLPAPPPVPRREESRVSLHPERFENAVRIDPEGNVLTGHGNQVEEQAALAAYVLRLGDLVGQLLGLEAMRAFDGSSPSAARWIAFRDQSGDTVALRPRAGVDISRLRAQLHL
ncbi:MAG TPA: DUF4388 domain-containing protein [Polyangiales bacterium]|nr:DUF4388 domain-containing protein [Polyangiales bacterium]